MPDTTGMETAENTAGVYFVDYGGIGYGFSVVWAEYETNEGPVGSWRVVAGPFTSREQAQAEADRRSAEATA